MKFKEAPFALGKELGIPEDFIRKAFFNSPEHFALLRVLFIDALARGKNGGSLLEKLALEETEMLKRKAARQ